MLVEHQELLRRAYEAFNARDVDAAVAAMHPDVDWPNAMEGGRVRGHRGVRDYRTRQFTLIDPHVDPQRFDTDAEGRIVVDVHQVVRDRAGGVVSDRIVQHVYTLQGGLIQRMDVRESSAARIHER